MNLIDGYVTGVNSIPYEKFHEGKSLGFFMDVRYKDMGTVGNRKQPTTTLQFKTIEEAREVKVGYHFLH